MAQCKANTTSGQPCKKPAIQGGTVCYSHGGAAPQTKRKANKNAETKKLQTYLQNLGIKKDGATPEQLLQETVEHAAGVLDYTAFMASQGDPLWVDAYTTALDQAARISKMAMDAGVMERQTKVQEAQAALLFRLIVGALQDIDLPLEQRTIVRKAIATRLRELEQ